MHVGDIDADDESSGFGKLLLACVEEIAVTRGIIEGQALYRAVDKRAYQPARRAADDYIISVDDIVGLVRLVADNQKYFIEKYSCFL